MQDIGIDIGDRVMLRSRSWRWLRVRILGLLNRPMAIDSTGQPVYPNRIQAHVYAPQIEQARARSAAATPN